MNCSSLRENTLLGIGHPFLDILVNIDKEFLERYKLSENKTLVATNEHDVLFKDIIENYNPKYLIGGCIHNALYVTQHIIGKPLVTTWLGCIGHDRNAELVEKEASKESIDVKFEKLQSKTTSSCAVLISDKSRTLVTRIGNSNFFSAEHVRKIWPIVEKAQFFYIMGFSLPMNVDLIMQVATHSYENDKMFIMNLSAEYICKQYKNEFMLVFPYIDIIFGNESEAYAFAESMKMETHDFRDLCLKISNLPKKKEKKSRICVITRGENPVICATGGNNVQEYPVIPVSQEKIVDTNGAGDAFVGGFLSQLIIGRKSEECIKCGLWASSISLQHMGSKFDYKSTYFSE